ncbi:MAG: DUF5655 domain-containing protein [Eubacteriales bacterium]|nr:DUF5655 domain-containing protein [Eubacteriales bacterium]
MQNESNLDVYLFFDQHPYALSLFEQFRQKLLVMFPETGMRVQKTQITFTNPRVFACVSMAKVRKAKDRPKEYIVVTFGLGTQLLSPRIDVATEPYPNRWTHHVLISGPQEIDEELMEWIQMSYDFAIKK